MIQMSNKRKAYVCTMEFLESVLNLPERILSVDYNHKKGTVEFIVADEECPEGAEAEEVDLEQHVSKEELKEKLANLKWEWMWT
jgi:hypothetical protein